MLVTRDADFADMARSLAAQKIPGAADVKIVAGRLEPAAGVCITSSRFIAVSVTAPLKSPIRTAAGTAPRPGIGAGHHDPAARPRFGGQAHAFFGAGDDDSALGSVSV
jgi:hypothetical protein